jgi:hypothetical protein
MGISWTMWRDELTKISIDDIQDENSALIVTVSDTNTAIKRTFTLSNPDFVCEMLVSRTCFLRKSFNFRFLFNRKRFIYLHICKFSKLNKIQLKVSFWHIVFFVVKCLLIQHLPWRNGYMMQQVSELNDVFVDLIYRYLNIIFL